MGTPIHQIAQVTPDDGLWQIAILLLSVLLSLWGGFKFGQFSERRSEKRAATREFIVTIEKVISASYGPHPAVFYPDSIDIVEDAVLRFRLHLAGDRLLGVNRAWEQYQKIKSTDMFPNNTPGWVSKGQEQDMKDARAILHSPLNQMIDEAKRS